MYSVEQIELILRAVYVEAWPQGEFNNAPIGKVFQQIKNTMEGANLQTNNSARHAITHLELLKKECIRNQRFNVISRQYVEAKVAEVLKLLGA